MFVGHQTAARGYAAATGAVLWSRVAGAASARLDGVGLDAALSWKLTAVMGLTMTEVTFFIICHIISPPSFLPPRALSFLACCPFHSINSHLDTSA